MDIDNQLITIRVINSTEKHFKSLGYNVKNGDVITIPAKDLPKCSGIKINFECCYCHKIFQKSWRRYLETKDKCCCDDCKELKMMETSLEKYGNICSLRNPEVQAKSKATNMKNLGVQYPFQNPNILQKCRDSYIKNNNDTVMISKQQKHLCDLYGGVLNYPISLYFADILLDDIVIEYDGRGHDLAVRLNYISADEFNKKEYIREQEIIRQGYKIFRIISNNDKLLTDDLLLKIKDDMCDTLHTTSYNVATYNIDTQEMVFR